MPVGPVTKQKTYLLNVYAENPLGKIYMLQKRSKYIYMCVFFKRIENIYVENNFCLVTINTQSETSSALESRIPS